MKNKLFTLALSATILFLGMSCGSASGNDPVATAKQFAEAYYKYDLEKCRSMMGSFFEDSDIETEMEMFDKKTAEALRKVLQADGYSVSYDADESRISDDNASIDFDVTSKSYKDYKGTCGVSLEKVDGKWLVKRARVDVAPGTREKMMKVIMD